MMLRKGIKNATIQTDNLKVSRVLQENMMTDSSIIVLRRVQRIMRFEGNWCIRYIPRDINKVADYLAKLSLTGSSSLQVYDSAPNELLELIQQDKNNDAFIQFIFMQFYFYVFHKKKLIMENSQTQ